jgi:hypothetical protein
MTAGDRFFVGDFSGEGRSDFLVFNGTNWSMPYLGMLLSNGSGYSMAHRYDSVLPGWQMTAGDRFYVGDFDGDRRSDVYVFNGRNWSMAYLGMLRSTGTGLAMARRYDGTVPGWHMRKNDQFFVGNVNADNRDDLFVYNCNDWATQYLGTMRSGGNSLAANWTADWVGEWNLGTVDRFEPCNYEGAPGKRDLVVHNQNWIGLMRAAPGLQLQRLYYRWIHNYRYGRNW